MRAFSLEVLWLLATSAAAFVSPSIHGRVSRKFASPDARLQMATLSEGDPVMLIGPGFLQLVLAKALKAVGMRPIVVAPQTKLDKFGSLINDDEIMKDSTIGMPEVGEPYFGEIAGVVFCSEEAILPPSIVSSVLDYTDQGKSAFANGGKLKKVLCCAPLSNKVQEEKSMGWIPVFNSDKNDAKIWKTFVDTYVAHPDSGPLIRYGSLFGGSVDGPEFLAELGLDEGMYKMSFEQYRDLRERAFDRYRLGVQILEGDAVNPQPPKQEKMEKEGISNSEQREAFKISGGYPEIDRSCRHSVAQATVQALLRGDVPPEFTVLSKSVSEFPSEQEWDELFSNPGPAAWPDPFAFDPEALEIEK